MKKPNIAIVCPYPFNMAPGQRFRHELYLDALSDKFDFKIYSFLDERTNKILYKKGNFIRKVLGVLQGFIRRIFQLFGIMKSDYVYLFREFSPIGPPIFEFIVAKILRKKIIYDFDDAIWLANHTTHEKQIGSYIRSYWKVGKICSWSYKVSVGNNFLGDFARKNAKKVICIPTAVDTEDYHNRIQDQENSKINIGWTGSHSTLWYLDQIVPLIQKLEKEYNFDFYVIANRNPELPLKGFKFIKWNESTEIADLLKFHIGLMPLMNRDWEKGKCGFKAIQYMSLGIPPVVSNVGVNKDIVIDQISGFVCNNLEEWEKNLRKLLEDKELRKNIGTAARTRAVNFYSKSANMQRFEMLFS